MKILIQSAQILDKKSPHHGKKRNVLITHGRITDIGDKNYQADRVIEAAGMILSTGWVDIGSFVGDPGLEFKEDLLSLGKTAAAGGFTDVAVLPNTVPTVQTKNEVAYIRQGNESRLVQLYPLAAVTRGNKGEELTEMLDLHEAGAVGFTDGLKSVWHTDIFLKTLQYLQKVNGLLIDHPSDSWLTLFGQMHEGEQSTSLGLKGMPRLAEEVALARNLELLHYAGGRLHVTKVSTARSLELIRAAKRKGLNVTCDVTTYQALLDDSLLHDFDTNYKVNPPLREKADQDAILKALKDGTIDVLTTGHLPQDEESKMLEFDLADFGIINLQTAASHVSTLSKTVELEDLVDKLTDQPRKILGIPLPSVAEDQKANLTLYAPHEAWTFTAADNYSKSKNSPWLGKELVGRAVAVFNNGKQVIHE
jgi:dihydroorotase